MTAKNRFASLFAFGLALVAVLAIAPAFAEEAAPAAAEAAEAEAPKTAAEVIKSDAQLTTFAKLVEAAGLGEVLAGKEAVTVCAPVNAAFAEGTLETLLAEENKAKLLETVQNQIVKGKVLAGDLKTDAKLTTLSGKTVAVKIAEDGTVTIGGAKVVKADGAASNGVIHQVAALCAAQAVEAAAE